MLSELRNSSLGIAHKYFECCETLKVKSFSASLGSKCISRVKLHNARYIVKMYNGDIQPVVHEINHLGKFSKLKMSFLLL